MTDLPSFLPIGRNENVSLTKPESSAPQESTSSEQLDTANASKTVSGRSWTPKTFIIPDTRAIDLLLNDMPPSFLVVEKVDITGFEMYIVEQWALTRRVGTTITIYTGDDHNVLKAYKITVTIDEENLWPMSFKKYVNSLILSQSTTLREISDAYLFVTNLSQFPTNLNLIPVKEGSLADIWDLFVTNLNMKRLSCAGRSLITLTNPANSIHDKFTSRYSIHPDVPLMYAARELVLIVQTFLYYFRLIRPLAVDGMACTHTEEAICQWWEQFGIKSYPMVIKPKDFFSPLSLCGLIGFVLTIRERLASFSMSIYVPSDPLLINDFKVSVGQFQRHIRKLAHSSNGDGLGISPLPNQSSESAKNTWYLDVDTVDILLRYTSHKGSNKPNLMHDINKVRRMFKNTVQDLSSGKSLQSFKNTVTDLSTGRTLQNLGVHSDVPACSAFEFPGIEVLTDFKLLVPRMKGKRMNYLWKGKGKPFDIERNCISSLTLQYTAKSWREKTKHESFSKNRSSTFLPEGRLEDSSSNHYERYDYYLSNEAQKESGNTEREEFTIERLKEKLKSKIWFEEDETTSSGKEKTKSPVAKSKLSKGEQADNNDTEAHRSQTELCNLLEREPKIETVNHNEKFYSLLHRRNSIPSAQVEANLNTISYQKEYAVVDTVQRQEPFISTSIKLKRSKSFSEVEPVVNQWNWSFCPSVERLALAYIRIKCNMDRGFSVQASQFNQDYEEVTHLLATCVNDFAPLAKVSLDRKLSCGEGYLFDMLKGILDKSKNLEFQLNDIDSLNAKLDYELRLLSQKVKDAEQSLVQLKDFKVNNLIRSLDNCGNMNFSKRIRNQIKQKGYDTQVGQYSKEQGYYVFFQTLVQVLLGTIVDIWLAFFPGINYERVKKIWIKVDPRGRTNRFIGRIVPTNT
ncbi:Sin3p binding protein [Komagataella phaffii CBS 7435]|uniref:Protein that interacts with Sin3p in a two-hybrid assay n=2 Tax=Komagataella phaffii TaxID=460519 RepID=C4R7D6_KOMPG|nr:Protein that interacts with Sin3p in a two-hybrid assay [Komagataella phaffii GS115]AOA65043.1 GQ67_04604T0 [Komagataella phaffii]CAH2451117.1 Sin3p binding protein [Komagataella phaffii CBS 7435]AOA70248.1 GQ68_04576T0 [Komagataella phaffii GS115]CAY71511.1 Protein that interacts with Sin3p in a two-hybrid assay [Komagataella phaffii GS115]SCV12402.1 Sin3p binding protein [Komagataella phaffii CBS 7435]